MAQKRIQIDGKDIWQPDEDMQWDFETTYTPDSSRPQNGEGHFTELFTTHSLAYSASRIPAAETKKILQLIIGRKYQLTAFIPYYGEWRTKKCYTGKGTFRIKTLEENGEKFNNISFNAVFVSPLKPEE